MALHSSILAWKIPWMEATTVHGVAKSRTRLSDFTSLQTVRWGFPGGSVVKNMPANAGDTGDPGTVPGLGRSPGV